MAQKPNKTAERLAQLKTEPNNRPALIEGVDKASRTAQLAFSSDRAAVERWFGKEVLGHAPGEVRLGRLNDSGALLMDHNQRDQIGVVEQARVDPDGVGRATVRFGQSARAQEIFQDVADGIRKHISVGYAIHGMRLESQQGDEETYRITDWEPLEISVVSVPADHSVGFGRSLQPPEQSPGPVAPAPAKPENNPEKPTPAPESTEENRSMTTPPDAPVVNVDNERAEAAKNARAAEQARVKAIMDLGRQYGALDLAAEYAANPDGTEAALSRALLERGGKAPPVPPKNADIGMNARDLEKYSILRAVRALANPGNRKFQDEAKFEKEVSEEATKNQRNQSSGNLVIPTDVLRHTPGGSSTMLRDMNAGTNGQTGPGSTGGATVATNLLAGSYIDILRAKAIFAHGTRMLGGLVGNIDIPKQTGATQGYWLGEGEDATASTMDFGSVNLSPKTVGAYSDLTRRLLMQSSLDVELLLRSDLARAMALSIDLAGYYGSGEKQPLGLANMPGISATAFAGSFPNYAELVEMETTIAEKNAEADGMIYKARPSFRGYAKQTQKFAGSAGPATIWEPGNTVNGLPCLVSTQIKTGDMFFGNWNDIIMGLWGGLELNIDPYSLSKSGSVRIVTFQDIDWQVRRLESFVLGRPKGATAPASGS